MAALDQRKEVYGGYDLGAVQTWWHTLDQRNDVNDGYVDIRNKIGRWTS